MTSETTRFRLSNQQLQQFNNDGYVVVDHLFDDDELQPVIDEISADLDQRCRQAVSEGKLSRTYKEYDFEHRLTYVDRENQDISKLMWDNKVVLPSFFGLMTNPKLLDINEQLCGPELIASSVYRLRPKVPSHSWSPVPWHQDSGYFEPYCDLGTYRDRVVATGGCHRGAWLPVGDAGCAQGRLLLPQTRRHGTLPGDS